MNNFSIIDLIKYKMSTNTPSLNTELQQLKEDVSKLESRNKFLMEFIKFSLNENDRSTCPKCNGKHCIVSKKILDLGWDKNKQANIGVFKSMCAMCEYVWQEKSEYHSI